MFRDVEPNSGPDTLVVSGSVGFRLTHPVYAIQLRRTVELQGRDPELPAERRNHSCSSLGNKALGQSHRVKLPIILMVLWNRPGGALWLRIGKKWQKIFVVGF